MPTRRPRMALLVAAAAVAAAAAAGDSHAAAPRFILVTGPGLQRPAVLGNWNENLQFLVELIPPRRPAADWRTDRPRYRLALFWGVPSSPVPTKPAEANQVGWFYPAVKGRRAVIVLLVGGQDGPRLATQKTLHILARHRIPTRVR